MAQYHLARDGQQLGVFSEAEVESGLASGKFSASDLHWTDGMGDWLPVSTRFQTQPLYAPAVTASPGSGAFNPYAAPLANVSPVGLNNGVVLASLGKRLGAFLLDALVWGVVVGIPYVIFIFQMQPAPGQTNPEFTPVAMAAGGATLLAFLVLVVITCVLLTKRGQTLGKKWVGIRIVEFPGAQKPGFVKAVLLRNIVSGIIGGIPCLGALYTIVDYCFIFREDRRCLHDLIASTQVIEGSPPEE